MTAEDALKAWVTAPRDAEREAWRQAYDLLYGPPNCTHETCTHNPFSVLHADPGPVNHDW